MITKCEVVDGIAFALMPNGGFFETDLTFSRISDSLYPTVWSIRELCNPSATLFTPTCYVSHNLTALVYVLSNGRYKYGRNKSPMELLGEELQRLPRVVVARLFRSHSLSFRALWDRFVWNCLESIEDPRIDYDRGGMAFMVNMVLDIHPEWTLGKESELLFLAAFTGQLALVNRLLARGARPMNHLRWGKTALSKASSVGAQTCFKAMIESHNVNAFDVEGYPTKLMSSAPSVGGSINWVCDIKVFTSSFSLFLCYVFRIFDSSREPWLRVDGLEVVNSKEERVLHTLDIFLDAGADVDSSFPVALCGLYYFRELYDRDCKWLPSCLDVVFYLCNPIFQRIQSRSKKDHGTLLTRSGTCDAATKGALALKVYLSQRMEHLEQKQYLELVLLEQFFLRRSEGSVLAFRSTSEAKVSRTLIDLGVTIDSKNLGIDTNYLSLVVCILSVKKFGLNEDLLYLVDHFLHKELRLSSRVLADCVEREGIDILEAIARTNNDFCVSDFRALGGLALLQAAKSGNYEAVAWLLKMGADINSEVDEGSCATILGHLLTYSFKIPMIQHLINMGAKLRYRISDDNCYPLFEMAVLRLKVDEVLLNLPREELKRITPAQWNVLLRKLATLNLKKRPDALELFKRLLRQFYVPSAGPILGTLISAGATRELIQELLNRGADVNEWPHRTSPLQKATRNKRFGLAYWLIELGADINNPQSVERPMASTLYTACMLYVNSDQEQRKRKDIILFLLSQGADVNGNTDSDESRNFLPLYTCASTGDVEIAAILLQNGAKPNSISSFTEPKTALDVAAGSGRLDMVQLLLKVGGLSVETGLSGYDGAIQSATNSGYGAVAELIKRHVCHNEQQFELCPELRRNHQAIIICLQEAVKNTRAQGGRRR